MNFLYQNALVRTAQYVLSHCSHSLWLPLETRNARDEAEKPFLDTLHCGEADVLLGLHQRAIGPDAVLDEVIYIRIGNLPINHSGIVRNFRVSLERVCLSHIARRLVFYALEASMPLKVFGAKRTGKKPTQSF